MIIKTPSKSGLVLMATEADGKYFGTENSIHILEWLEDKFPVKYKYDRMHAKISALKFRYSVLESHGEMIPVETLESDLKALAEIAEYCINNG